MKLTKNVGSCGSEEKFGGQGLFRPACPVDSPEGALLKKNRWNEKKEV